MTSETPVKLKRLLRSAMRKRLGELSPKLRAEASSIIVRRIREDPRWMRARRILLYVPLKDEPDLWPLLETALVEGKAVALPRFESDAGIYGIRAIRHPQRDLRPGPHGILEPGPDQPRWDHDTVDLVTVPGLAFSCSGARLGRGKGYYDRILEPVTGKKCGVGFDFQVQEELPIESHDIALDCLVTPRRWHEFTR